MEIENNLESYFDNDSYEELLGEEYLEEGILDNNSLIEEWIKKHAIIEGSYNIDKNHRINVKGNVLIDSSLLETDEFPSYINFNEIKGNFYLNYSSYQSKLKSLLGCPKKVEGTFDCSYCIKLETLEGAPEECNTLKCAQCSNLKSLKGISSKIETLIASDCKSLKNLKHLPNMMKNLYIPYCSSLENLEGAPRMLKGDFVCTECMNLSSLKGGPVFVKNNYECNYCESLTSLEGAAKEVGGNFECMDCFSLKTLKGAPSLVKMNFYCDNTNISSFRYGPKVVKGNISCLYVKKRIKRDDIKKYVRVDGFVIS